MNISVIGTIVYDIIINYHSEQTESFGGLTYVLQALAYLTDKDTKIYPISNMGKDKFPALQSFFKEHPQISFDGIYTPVANTNEVTLKYYSPSERIEIQSLYTSPLTIPQIKPFLKSDIIIINMVSGSDLSLETLNYIKKYYKGLLYFDYHSLALGINEQKERFYRPLENWREWFNGLTVLQLNEQELNTLTDIPLNKEEALNYILSSLDLQIINLTLGAKGSLCAYKSEDGIKIKYFETASINAIDPTGCGDVFSAAFPLYFFYYNDVIDAMVFANYVAGLNVTQCGLEGMSCLKEAREMMK